MNIRNSASTLTLLRVVCSLVDHDIVMVLPIRHGFIEQRIAHGLRLVHPYSRLVYMLATSSPAREIDRVPCNAREKHGSLHALCQLVKGVEVAPFLA